MPRVWPEFYWTGLHSLMMTTLSSQMLMMSEYKDAATNDIAGFVVNEKYMTTSPELMPWPLTPSSIPSFFWRIMENYRSHQQKLLLHVQSGYFFSNKFENDLLLDCTHNKSGHHLRYIGGNLMNKMIFFSNLINFPSETICIKSYLIFDR